MPRPHIESTIETKVLTKSKRRCALCVGLDGNLSQRPGQIAHINGKNSDHRFENLAWLCQAHHDQFDSRTSQTKNYTANELRYYVARLYEINEGEEYDAEEVKKARKYLEQYADIFNYLFQEYGDLAFRIDLGVMESLRSFVNEWKMGANRLQFFNQQPKDWQNGITTSISQILDVFDSRMYDGVGRSIVYDVHNFDDQTLRQKKSDVRGYVDAIVFYYKRIEEIAIS